MSINKFLQGKEKEETLTVYSLKELATSLGLVWIEKNCLITILGEKQLLIFKTTGVKQCQLTENYVYHQ